MSRYSPPGRGPERWDRSRFDAHTRGPPVAERDIYEEHDYYAPPQRQRERSADPYYREPPRAPPTRYQEEDRFFFEEKDRYSQPMPFRSSRPAPRYYEETRDPYEGAMVPVPRPREREIEIDIHERDRYAPPSRPKFVRRQSSLDTFDRKPMPRYGDRVREETILIPSGPRRRSPPRYHSPPRFVERDYEDIRIAEPDAYGDEEFRGYREREIERVRRRRSQETLVQESIVEDDKTEIIEEKKEYPRRGKTRMPMRLINRRAVIELGYPFEEEGETLIIQRALGKEHIDEVIRISKEMNTAPPSEAPSGPGEREVRTTTYVFEHDKHQQKPPPPDIIPIPPPPDGFEEKIVERRTEIIRDDARSEHRSEVPRSVRDWDVLSKKTSHRSPSPASSHHTSHTRKSSHTHRSRRRSRAHSHSHSRARSDSSDSTKRELIITEDREESATIAGGIGALIVPEHRDRRDSKAIKREIRELEAERRALKYEREGHRVGEGGEIIIARERRSRSRSRSKDRDTVEVKKDKKAPDPRIIRAMLATLT